MKGNLSNIKTFFLSFFIFAVSIATSTSVFGQSIIETAKKQLVELNNQLEEIDSAQRDEIAKLEKQSGQKGEFETTKQYEERSEEESKKLSSLYIEVDNQQGTRREEIYRKINTILSKQYSGVFNCSLGTYDADKQRFPLFIEGNFIENLFVPLAEAKDLKENLQNSEKTGMLGLVLNKSNEAEEYLISGKIKFQAKTYVIDTSKLSNSRAMQMMFGNYDEKTKYSAWRLAIQRFFVDGSDENQYVPATVYAKLLTVKSYTNQGVEKRVLVTQTAPTLEDNTCHACSVFVGVAVFSNQNGIWKVEQAQKNIGRFGSFGEVALPTIVKIGTNSYALKFESFYMNMGEEAGGEQYITLDEGIFNEIFSISTVSDNTASMTPIKNQESTKSKVIFKPSTESKYFDAVVTISGKKAKKVGNRFVLSPFIKTELYRVSNGKYKLVKN